jgi:hypothetical protein
MHPCDLSFDSTASPNLVPEDMELTIGSFDGQQG